MYSIVNKKNSQVFTFRANTPLVVQVLTRESLNLGREQFKELDNMLKYYNSSTNSDANIPVCDYKCFPVANSLESGVKEKFRMAVNRSMVLNEYENKKNSKIGLLIEQLKRQNAENELKELKKQKRDRHKKNLSKLIANHLKDNMPNYDESSKF